MRVVCNRIRFLRPRVRVDDCGVVVRYVVDRRVVVCYVVDCRVVVRYVDRRVVVRYVVDLVQLLISFSIYDVDFPLMTSVTSFDQ